MNLSAIPVGATYCLPMGCFRVVSYVSYPWVTHIVSTHKALTLTLFCVNLRQVDKTNRLPMQYFNRFILFSCLIGVWSVVD